MPNHYGPRKVIRAAIIVACFLLAGCNDCLLDEPIGSSVTCEAVFDGEYLACHGWGWEEPTRNWCEAGDFYLLSFGKSVPGGGHRVDKEIRIPPSDVITGGLFFDSQSIVEANKTTREVCFRVTDPATCFQVTPDVDDKESEESQPTWEPPEVQDQLASKLDAIFGVVPGRDVPDLTYDFDNSPFNEYELPVEDEFLAQYFQHLTVSVLGPRTVRSLSAVRAYSHPITCNDDYSRLHALLEPLFPNSEQEYGGQWLSDDGSMRLLLSCSTTGNTPYLSLELHIIHLPSVEESRRRLDRSME